MLSIKNNILLVVVLLLSGCQYFNNNNRKKPVAKVYDSYLFLEDISPNIYQNKKGEDSVQAVHQYIENWAYKTLLLQQAKQNVDTLKISNLVKQYHEDLLIDTYKNLLVQKKLDTTISLDTLTKYYQKDKDFFKAIDPLVNVNYLVVSSNNPNRLKYKKWFFSNKQELKDSLIHHSLDFKQFDITGEKWYDINDFKQKFKAFSNMSERYILKKSKKFVLNDSLTLSLVFVNNVVYQNEALPLGFIKDDIKRLILNKRKQASMSSLQKELKDEALKHKNFKIY